MDLIFAGTPAFAVPTLAALSEAGHRIRAVYTQPDRRVGRGQQLGTSPVKAYAQRLGVDTLQPTTLKDTDAAETLRGFAADAMIVVAYGLILPPAILSATRIGAINVHASLLPRWRGAAPIARAIEAGDAVTGVTIMHMDAGLDTGPTYSRRELAIAADDTNASLHDKLSLLGAELLVESLPAIAAGTLAPIPQPATGATYARKLSKDEGRLDWHAPAASLARKVRAFFPWPGAHCTLAGRQVKILGAVAAPAATAAPAGHVLACTDAGINVATGAGVLVVTHLQREGGAPLPAAEFARGQRLAPGSAFQ